MAVLLTFAPAQFPRELLPAADLLKNVDVVGSATRRIGYSNSEMDSVGDFLPLAGAKHCFAPYLHYLDHSRSDRRQHCYDLAQLRSELDYC